MNALQEMIDHSAEWCFSAARAYLWQVVFPIFAEKTDYMPANMMG